MPTVLPVTEVTMNYASVVFGGFLAISVAWYFFQGRHGQFPIIQSPSNDQVLISRYSVQGTTRFRGIKGRYVIAQGFFDLFERFIVFLRYLIAHIPMNLYITIHFH